MIDMILLVASVVLFLLGLVSLWWALGVYDRARELLAPPLSGRVRSMVDLMWIWYGPEPGVSSGAGSVAVPYRTLTDRERSAVTEWEYGELMRLARARNDREIERSPGV